MSGGMFFAVRDALSTADIAAGVAGFRFFGLDEAAAVFGEATTVGDDDLEFFDERYWAVVPDDDVLVAAFKAKLAADAESFAPVAPET